MGYYYDYTQEFQSLITNTNTIIENQNNLITCLTIFIFIFTAFFIYTYIRNMIKSQKGDIYENI